MKAYVILALVILGYLTQSHAAAMNSHKEPVEGLEEVQQKIYQAVMEKREDIIAAVKTLKSSTEDMGDETDEQFFQAVAIPVVTAVASGAAGAGVEGAIRCG
ncbi:uncharacterized protein LOC144111481 [Amblyomma americanum]